MSKKSYKRMQNRLYREIKARIIAEKKLDLPVQFWPVRETRHIDTLKVSSRRTEPAGYNTDEFMEYEKARIAMMFADKLLEDGYIDFHTEKLEEGMYLEVCTDARLDVVKPREGICWDEL